MIQLFFACLFTCRLNENNIGNAGAKALGEGLQHCTKLQELRYLPTKCIRIVVYIYYILLVMLLRVCHVVYTYSHFINPHRVGYGSQFVCLSVCLSMCVCVTPFSDARGDSKV